MTRDFAKQKRTHSTPRKTRQNSTNKRTFNNKTQSTIPAWIWALTGMLAGILFMLLLYVTTINSRQSVTNAETNQTEDTKTKQTDKNQQPQPHFGFYQLLKEQEVVVPDTMPELADTESDNTVYLLQAGSFRNSADADQLRAQLLLLNLTATVEKARTRTGDTWHRVLVGPFESRSKLAKARSILASNEISSLLLKRQR